MFIMPWKKISPSPSWSYSYTLILMINLCITLGDHQDDPQILLTKLIHQQSTNSPFYDPTRSIKDHADMDLTSSISRAQSLIANSSTPLELTDIDTQLTPGKLNGFLVYLRVGSYLENQYVYMDTGSNLLWINCEPCGLKVPGPIFDPKFSATYQPENCDYGDSCSAAGAVKIDCNDYFSNVDGCKFEVVYGSRGSSKGFLARETFRFGNETLENIVFGCARSTSLFMNGILGLGSLGISLLSQYNNASKFSYCIGNINDRSYEYNELVIGNKVELWGSQTPLIVEGKYYINLQGISVGKTSLTIDPKKFKRNSFDYSGGMIVDSGSTLTFIPMAVLTLLEEAVSQLIEKQLRLPLRPNNTVKDWVYTRLCYSGVLTRDLTRFPTVKFQFQGNAIMELTVENIFQQIDDQTFCLAILPSDLLGTTTISILGILMQQHFYVAYDLQKKMLSFKRMDCKAVDDYYEHDEL